MTRYSLLPLLLVSILLPSLAQAEEICAKVKHEAGSEIIVRPMTKGSAKGVLACAYMDASTEAVYAAVVDYPSFPKWMDKVDAIKAEWSNPTTAMVDYEIGTLFGTFKYKLKREHQKNVAVRWNRVSGDLKHVSGRYAFLPLPGGKTSLFVLETYVDPGKPLPGFIESYFTQKGSRQVITDVRSEVARRLKE